MDTRCILVPIRHEWAARKPEPAAVEQIFGVTLDTSN
jgi:hypothetical protein